MRNFLFLLPFFLWTCGGGSTEPEPPQLPTVTNIEVTTLEDTAKTFALTGTDPNNLALTYSISTQPQHGTISISGGAATYNPNANYYGQDVIAFLASSTNGNSNIGTIIITITPVDDEPNTMDVTATTDEDNSVTMTLEAEEYDGENIEFLVRNNPSNGSVTISGTTATYTPNQDWYGTDQFNFEAVDSNSRSVLNVATAIVTINPVNDAPTVEDVNDIEAMLTQTIDINLPGTDIDGDNLSFSIVSQPSNGSIESITNNIVKYIPNSVGDDSFTFQANDGTENSVDVGTVNIHTEYYNKIVNQNSYQSYQPRVKDIIKTDEGYLVFYNEGDNGVYRPSKAKILDENLNIVREFSLDDPSLVQYESISETTDGNFILAGGAGNDQKLVLSLIDASGGIIQSRQFDGGGSNNDAYGFHAIQTSDGGFIATGFSDVPNTNFVSMLIVKANENLNTVWFKTIHKYNYYDRGYEVYETSDGGFVIGGHSSSTDTANYSMHLVKLDGSGNEVWSQDFNQAVGRAYSMKIADDGGFIIAGNAVSGSGNAPTALIRKVDSSGNEEWSYELTSFSEQGFLNIDVLNNGDFLAVGYADNDMLIEKFSSSGSLLWSKLIGNSDIVETAYSSEEIISSNELIILGYKGLEEGAVWAIKLNSNE